MSERKYTKVSWDSLQDYPGETSRIYSGPLACEHIAFIINRQEPGSEGVHHAHEKAEEIYVLLQGSAQIKVEDETIELQPLDAVRVPPKIEHSTHNPTENDALWLVMGSPTDEFIEFDPVAYGPPAA